LTFETLAQSPLADLVRPHRIVVERRVAYLSFLEGPADLPRVRAALRGVNDVVVFDQRGFLRGAYARYRQRTLAVLGAGLALVLALLLARYRRVSTALSAMAPAVLACAGTLGALGLAGVRANLLHLVGVILVLSVGVDYGIFMAEIRRHPEAAKETVLSVTVAWCTAVLSFGLLAVSDAVPLRAIGLTTGLGVTLSLLLAPMARPAEDRA
jgi:predicted exporter